MMLGYKISDRISVHIYKNHDALFCSWTFDNWETGYCRRISRSELGQIREYLRNKQMTEFVEVMG